MKVLSGHDFIKSTKDKQSFLLLVSEEELQAVKEILEREEWKKELPLKEHRKEQRRIFYGRRQTTVERRKIGGGRRDINSSGCFKDRRSS